MKTPIILLFLCILFGSGQAGAQSECPVIPRPASSSRVDAVFQLNPGTSINCRDASLAPLAGFLQQQLLRYTGIAAGRELAGPATTIVLEADKTEREVISAKEGYSIEMRGDRVLIRAATTAGMFNGIATFLQLARLAPAGAKGRGIPCWNIEDAPYYAWRGVMLDESRHFYGMETVKFILDWMAFYKLNRFHWHLTDSPGWRIEIQKYPRLTLVGGIGDHTDPLAPAAYYTQEEIAEIVAYARQRHIEIIPEIDMPGHATASNRAYPEYSGGGSERYPEFTFNPGLEETYGYLTDILRETDALFPSQMIHLGGDEVHFGNARWKSDPGIQELMKKHRLKDLKAVEQYFIRRMSDSLLKMNNKVLGWDEIAGTDLPAENTVIFWWRQEKPETLQEGLEKGYSVVLCPRLPLYFDFVQDSLHRSGRRWGGKFAPIEDVLSFSHAKVISDPDRRKQVLGIQANLWTETSRSRERLEFLLFPRISALSAAAWTGPGTGGADPGDNDTVSFKTRLKKHLELYKAAGIYYYNPFSPEAHPEVIR